MKNKRSERCKSDRHLPSCPFPTGRFRLNLSYAEALQAEWNLRREMVRLA